MERAVLVGIDTRGAADDSLEELSLLTDTAGAQVVGRITQRRAAIEPATFLSRGKRSDAHDALMLHDAELLIFDEDLSPAQARNLEKELKVRVLDRSELILDIFARRARTREAMLQVELAQLEYMLPRLTKMWEHFGRLGGGIGTRGPGETQLEVDRRRVRKRISMLREKLKAIDRERETQRKGREEFPCAALVGYTNAGKSTLFNALTRSDVPAEDKLFATLDTTTRQVMLPGRQVLLLSDTVGFIRKLPHHLVASFRATLLEVRQADLIVHIVDASHPAHEEQMKVVEQVLSEILTRDVARLVVLNKADRLEDEVALCARRLRHPEAEIVSALDPRDVGRLRDRLAQETTRMQRRIQVRVPIERLGEAQAILRRARAVRETYADGHLEGVYAISPADARRLERSGFHVHLLQEEEIAGV